MRRLSIPLVLLALVAAGCGDDEEEPAATTATEATGATGAGGASGTKAAFIAAADQICADASAELATEAQAQYPEGPPTGEDAADFANEVVIPNLQGQLDAISDLDVPEGEEEAVADLLAKLQAGIDELEGDPEGFLESGGLTDASEAAEKFGLTSCGL